MAKKKVSKKSKVNAAEIEEMQKYMQSAVVELQAKLDEFDKNELHRKTLVAFIRLKDDKPRSVLEKVQDVETLVQNLGGFAAIKKVLAAAQ